MSAVAVAAILLGNSGKFSNVIVALWIGIYEFSVSYYRELIIFIAIIRSL